MEVEAVYSLIKEDLEEVNSIIRSSLSSDIRLLDSTNDSLLSNAGKQLRPVLTLLSAGACGGVNPDSLNLAAAAELLHNATLLHDDVADASPCRRGRPTVMSILGSRASVLVGDFWLVKAVSRVLGTSGYGNMLIDMFAKTLSDLAEGEMLQLQKAASGDTSMEDYFHIIYCKTASLFEVAAHSGAISAGKKDGGKYGDALASYGKNLGLAFQIMDDILDYEGGGTIGKPLGQDIREQKITLPLLGAFMQAPGEESEIRDKIGRIPAQPGLQAEIMEYVSVNRGTAYARDVLERYIGQAEKDLDVLPPSSYKDALIKLAEYCGQRDK